MPCLGQINSLVSSKRLVPILTLVFILNAIIILIIYQRLVTYHEEQHDAASTAESYFAEHGGMKALLREKEARARARANANAKAKPKINKHGPTKRERKPAVDDQPREPKGEEEPPSANPLPSYRRPRWRFPRFGTPHYAALCPWAVATNNSMGSNEPKQNCTFLSRPSPGSNEGVAAWTSQVVMNHLRVEQTSCNFLIDYGYNTINLTSIIQPHLEGRQARFHWAAPSKFECRAVDHCYENEGGFDNNKARPRNGPVPTDKTGGGRFGDRKGVGARFDFSRVPSYRHAFVKVLESDHLNAINYVELRQRLWGFQEEIGFACSLGKLFPSLSMDASRYEPRLFTDILPALQDEHSLVIALYIRTGQVDRQSYREEKGLEGDVEDTMRQGATRVNTKQNADCALALEKEVLALEPLPKRIVWLVVSDSNAAKHYIQSNYGNGTYVPAGPGAQMAPAGGNAGNTMQEKSSIARHVLFTNSKGRHTKPRKSPTTEDLADGFLDWYLIGESDFVITTAGLYSYGLTGGLRTSRPIYGAKTTNRSCVAEGGGVECSCDLLYDETERIHRLMGDN